MSLVEGHRVLKDAVIRFERMGALQAILRRRALRRLDRLEPQGVTIVIVSWNSNKFLETALAGVAHFADRPVKVVVIDNHSSPSPEEMTRRFGARLVRLPFNLRHPVALDIGFLTASTEYTVSLDADAFPFSPKWLPTFLKPLSEGSSVVGCQWWRPYAHPCCLAMRTRDFILGKHTFRPRLPVETGWDVGELISQRLGPERVAIVPKTGNIVGSDWYVGAIYGDVMYHNSYGSRHLLLADPDHDSLEPSPEFAMTRSYALNVWAEALRKFGPETW